MRVNQYLLDVYLSSKEGVRLVKAFSALAQLMRIDRTLARGAPRSTRSRNGVSREGRLVHEALDRYIPSGRLEGLEGFWSAVLRDLKARSPAKTLDEARELYLSLIRRPLVLDRDALEKALALEADLGWRGFGDDDDDDVEDVGYPIGGGTREGYKEVASYVSEISLALHVHSPEWFVPYGFAGRFDQFEVICSELNVPLSPLPGEKSHQERAEYYWTINEELVQLRQRLKLNPEEFNAFLYGFAVGYTETPVPEDLPPPQRAWLLLGTPDADYEFLQGASRDDVSIWQGSRGMRPRTPCRRRHPRHRQRARRGAASARATARGAWFGRDSVATAVSVAHGTGRAHLSRLHRGADGHARGRVGARDSRSQAHDW